MARVSLPPRTLHVLPDKTLPHYGYIAGGRISRTGGTSGSKKRLKRHEGLQNILQHPPPLHAGSARGGQTPPVQRSALQLCGSWCKGNDSLYSA